MLINRGQAETAVSSTDLEKIIGRLNFEVTAEDIWIEQYYDGQIKDYKSTLAITAHGQSVLKKTIEVNRPLHYGGYHFYQSGFDMLIGLLVLLPPGFIFTAESKALPPALQSWLFGPHVTVYMLAYIIMAKAAIEQPDTFAVVAAA